MKASETAVVFIEFQNEFCKDGGKLHEAVKGELARNGTIANAVRLLKGAREKGCLVVHCPFVFDEAWAEAKCVCGIIAGAKEGGAFRPGDWGTLALAIVGVSVPNFVLGTVLLYVFVHRLGWFDVGVVEGPQLPSLILPALTLAGFSLAFIVRMTRASMIEVLRHDYVRTAVAKGLPPSRVVWLHSLRNAVLPVVTYLGPLAAALLTGSFVVERIFHVPGLGEFFVQSLEDDPPAILGVALFYSSLLVVFNLAVDLLYGFADPRIAIGARSQK